MPTTLKALKASLVPLGFSVRKNYYTGNTYLLYPKGGRLIHGKKVFTYESACLADILKTAQTIYKERLTKAT